MASISITYEGPPAQRQVVKATAVAPLSSLLAEACAKMRPPLDPAHAKLIFNKKPLNDLACPFRLANIPAGSSLTLVYDKPAPSGGAAPTTTAPPTSAPAPAQAPPPAPAQPRAVEPSAAAAAAAEPRATCTAATAGPTAPTAAAPAASAAPPSPPPPPPGPATAPAPAQAAEAPAAACAPTAPPAADTQAPAASAGSTPAAVATAPVAPVAQAAATPHQPMDVDSNGATAAVPGSAADDSAGGEAQGGAPSGFGDLLGLGRPSVLFTRQALEAALAAASGSSEVRAPDGGEEGDDFFEVTRDDLASLLRSSQVRRQQEEGGGFRTRAAREAEERAKASSYSHVAIRAHLPGDVILQVAFAATETVADLRAAVHRVLVPELVQASYIYTTPPRQLLKPDQDGHTLYHVGLVPAAHVHIGFDEKKAAGRLPPASPHDLLHPDVRDFLQHSIHPDVAAFHASSSATGTAVGKPAGGPAGAAGSDVAAPDAAGSAAGRASGGGPAAGSKAVGAAGPKVPKWMKL